MGREKLRLIPKELPPFDKGFFPNKDFDDVPNGGSSDCKHVLWNRSALRKMYGMDLINASQAATLRGNGIHYFNVNGITKRVAVFGTKFYEDVSGTWTDRTGAITITDAAANRVQFTDHQASANKFVIGVNGVDAPFKWTGSGNAAVLGGSPPIFETGAKFNDVFFGSVKELVYPSASLDPETYNLTRDVINFTRDVKCQVENGKTLAVLMDNHIGSISGFDYLDFAKDDLEIDKVGTVGRLSATKAVFGKDTDVIATLSKDGLWIVDQSYGAEKLFGDDYIQEFNQANLSKATVAYSSLDHFLYVCAPYGASTENDYLIVVDMLNGALWPCPSIHVNNIRAMASMRDANGDEFIYFVDTNGYAFKFNRTTKNYHTGTASQAIDARFKTKKIDFKDIHQLRQMAMLADAVGDNDVTVAIGFGLTDNDGNTGAINLQEEGDLLDSSFILGASTLSGSDYIFKVLSGVGGFGRFMTMTFSNNILDQSFNIRKVEIQTSKRGLGSVAK